MFIISPIPRQMGTSLLSNVANTEHFHSNQENVC